MDDTTDPGPEVPERSTGPRRFPAAYKARILAAYDTLGKAEKGALLRWENLYSSLLTEWRRQRDRGSEEALSRPAGRRAADPRDG
jgi:transposase-like protein